MEHKLRLFILLTLICCFPATKAISNRGFQPDMTFLDFEDITDLFHKRYKQFVLPIKQVDSPVTILKAEVSDKGALIFESLKGAQNTYEVKVRNDSGKNILSYQVTWAQRHPFEDYIFHKIISNSINPLKAGAVQTFKFKRAKHYRDDAYYYVHISKVEFEDDESIWEAPDIDEYKRIGPMDKVKEEIDAMEDSNDLSNPDSINLDELKKNLEKLESEPLQIDDSGVKNKVELQEIKNDTVPQPVEQIKQEAEKLVPVEEVKTTTTTTTTETKIEAQSVKETEIVKEAPPVKEADVIKETEVMKETQVLNKNQNNEDEDDLNYEDEDFDFDEDEEFEFDEDEEEEF